MYDVEWKCSLVGGSFVVKRRWNPPPATWDPYQELVFPLLWRHDGHDGVSYHQPHDCLKTFLFRRRSKKRSKLRVTSLYAGKSPATGEFPPPHKWPVTRKKFPLDDVIMLLILPNSNFLLCNWHGDTLQRQLLLPLLLLLPSLPLPPLPPPPSPPSPQLRRGYVIISTI